jgi:hypothetical protein
VLRDVDVSEVVDVSVTLVSVVAVSVLDVKLGVVCVVIEL